MKKAYKTAALALGGAALVGAGAYLNSMFSLVSRRNSLLFKKTMAPKDEATERQQALTLKRELLRAMDLETVEIISHDGLRLVGHWYGAEDAKRTVICVHGWRGGWYYDFGSVYEFLHSNGCNLLFVEQRSHGESEGKYICYGQMERFDVQLWVDYVNHRVEGGLPLYLFGVSMGASTVLMASTLPLKDQVRGIIADCGFTEPRAEILETLKKSLGPAAKPVLAGCDLMSRTLARCGYDEYSTLEAMAENTLPILFIHGEEDSFVPAQMTLENYEACNSEKELLIIPGAEHARSHEAAPDLYEDTVLQFLEKYDEI